VRELYGDRLLDPAVVRELVVALSAAPRAPDEDGRRPVSPQVAQVRSQTVSSS
jgi:hypothetical protein